MVKYQTDNKKEEVRFSPQSLLICGTVSYQALPSAFINHAFFLKCGRSQAETYHLFLVNGKGWYLVFRRLNGKVSNR